MTNNFRIFLIVISLFFLAAHSHPASEATSIDSTTAKHVLKPRAGRVWTADEDAYLLALKNEGLPWSEITTRFPERTFAALTQRYYLLTADPTVPRIATGLGWRPHEEEILIEQEAAGKTAREIAEYLPGRTFKAIQAHSRRLKISGQVRPEIAEPHWTSEEIQTLIDALGETGGGRSFEEISQMLGKSVREVTLKAFYLRLKPLTRMNIWRSDEVSFLRQAVGEGMSSKEIARRLGRSEAAVNAKKQKLRKKGHL